MKRLILGLFVGAAFFSMWYFLTLYLQDVHGYGPLKAGLLFLPMGLAIIVGAQLSIRLIGRYLSEGGRQASSGCKRAP